MRRAALTHAGVSNVGRWVALGPGADQVDVPRPPVETGSLMLMLIMAVEPGAPNASDPEGWSHFTVVGGGLGIQVSSRPATSSEPASYPITTNVGQRSVAAIVAYPPGSALGGVDNRVRVAEAGMNYPFGSFDAPDRRALFAGVGRAPAGSPRPRDFRPPDTAPDIVTRAEVDAGLLFPGQDIPATVWIGDRQQSPGPTEIEVPHLAGAAPERVTGLTITFLPA